MIIKFGQSAMMALESVSSRAGCRAVARVGLCLALSLPLAAGCGGSPAASNAGDPIPVVAGFYPLRFVAERVGGDRVRVADLTKPGAEPHDLTLTARQIADIREAGLVVYLAGFQPEIDEAVQEQAKDRAFDAAAVEPLRPAPSGAADADHAGERHANEGLDPHVWLDPVRFAAIADRLAERFGELDRGHAADFRSRAGALRAELETLDREYTTGLATCQRRDLVTSHTAFGYLASRYRLEQVAITGVDPEEEVSPGRLTEVAEVARRRGATTIFFETLVSPKLAETLAREVGARAEVLDPIEGLPPGEAGDYLSIMRANLSRLRPALGCA